MEGATLTLHISLLGDFRLVYGEQPVATVNTARLQALLAYLVLYCDAPQPRYHLAFQFWPDSPEPQARTNLRKLFHQLHLALPDADRFLRADAQTVQWRPDAPFSLDVVEFERAAAQADSRRALQEAVALYRGDLLPSCYDDWIVPERERLRQRFVEVLERLVGVLEDERDSQAAIGYAQRLLQCDPLREATYCRLMRLHALSGDRAGVLRVYETCAAVLQRELGIEPGLATREARDRLLRMETPAVVPAPQPAMHNLPVPTTSFVGREREIAEVKQLLGHGRLVTLTGAGGCGKTRLALRVADDLVEAYPDGVWWVELAALTDPALVCPTLAGVLGVREQPGRPLEATLAAVLRPKRLLLLLDNCEHLAAVCARHVEALLHACPGLRCLVTSREALGVAGETTWVVPSLSVPPQQSPAGDCVSHVVQYEAVRLFAERAAAALPAFILTDENAAAVAQICRRLDGIPLALELAAARVKVLSPEQIVARLEDCFSLLTGGSRTALPRHQTLRATMDWSYDLLGEPERVLFRRLAVFAGGFTLEAAEAICADAGQNAISSYRILDLLSRLVDKSLVGVEARGQAVRYCLLETVREYARERLRQAGEEDWVRSRHLDFFLRLAEEAEPRKVRAGEVDAINRQAHEYDNLRAALEWSAAAEGRAESGLRLAGALFEFWQMGGYAREGYGWLKRLLERGGEAAAVRARALQGAGELAACLGDFHAACSSIEQGLALYRQLDDKPGIAYALLVLGSQVAMAQDDRASARPLLEECLALYRDLGDRAGAAAAMAELGYLTYWQGDCAAGCAFIEEGLAMQRELGLMTYASRSALFLGHIARQEGCYAVARSRYAECMAILWEMKVSYGLFYALAAFGCLAAAEGRLERAARLCGATERVGEAAGVVMVPHERTWYDRAVAAARAGLGAEAFATAWAAGRAMTLEEAVAYALEEAEPRQV
jgi:predicted ATPase/DNA-binding SARP family transcriptional activator